MVNPNFTKDNPIRAAIKAPKPKASKEKPAAPAKPVMKTGPFPGVGGKTQPGGRLLGVKEVKVYPQKEGL